MTVPSLHITFRHYTCQSTILQTYPCPCPVTSDSNSGPIELHPKLSVSFCFPIHYSSSSSTAYNLCPNQMTICCLALDLSRFHLCHSVRFPFPVCEHPCLPITFAAAHDYFLSCLYNPCLCLPLCKKDIHLIILSPLYPVTPHFALPPSLYLDPPLCLLLPQPSFSLHLSYPHFPYSS